MHTHEHANTRIHTCRAYDDPASSTPGTASMDLPPGFSAVVASSSYQPPHTRPPPDLDLPERGTSKRGPSPLPLHALTCTPRPSGRPIVDEGPGQRERGRSAGRKRRSRSPPVASSRSRSRSPQAAARSGGGGGSHSPVHKSAKRAHQQQHHHQHLHPHHHHHPPHHHLLHHRPSKEEHHTKSQHASKEEGPRPGRGSVSIRGLDGSDEGVVAGVAEEQLAAAEPPASGAQEALGKWERCSGWECEREALGEGEGGGGHALNE